MDRATMHIMLDTALEILQGSQFNRLDSPIKDLWLNSTIDDFVRDVIDDANKPNPTKRLPNGVLLYKDIISKYNNIRTLIRSVELTNGSQEIYIPVSAITGNGTVVTVTSTKYHALQTGDRIIISGVTGGTGTWNGTFDITRIDANNFTFLSTGNGTATITNAVVRYEFDRDYQAFSLLTTPELYHFETSSSTITPIGCTKVVTISNVLPDTYDITAYNNNPYGGKRKYMATSIVNDELRLYNLGRYIIHRVNVIYIKSPAKLTSSPQVVNCDLPTQIHNKIVELTARRIAAYNNNDNFQPIATELNQSTQ